MRHPTRNLRRLGKDCTDGQSTSQGVEGVRKSRKMTPEVPNLAIWVVHGPDPRPRFHKKIPKEKKRATMLVGEGTKREIFGPPPFRAPHRSGPLLLWSLFFSSIEVLQTINWPKSHWPKWKLAPQFQTWPKSKLANLEWNAPVPNRGQVSVDCQEGCGSGSAQTSGGREQSPWCAKFQCSRPGSPWFVGDERLSFAQFSRPESSTALRWQVAWERCDGGGVGGGVHLSPR